MNGFQKTIKVFAIVLAITIIFSIVRATLFGLSFVTDIGFESAAGKDFSEVYKNVESIDINIAASHIVIKSGDEFKVVANDVRSSFSSKLNNGTLKIKDNKKWFINNNSSKKTIYIPKETELDDLQIESGAGKIEIENVLVDNFDVNQGAGLLRISDSRFNNVDIDGGVGATEIFSSVLNDLYLDAGVGSIDVEAKITGSSKIECGVGQIKLLLKGDESLYSIITEKGLGSIKINNERQSDNQVYGKGNNKIKVSGGVGDISIKFDN